MVSGANRRPLKIVLVSGSDLPKVSCPQNAVLTRGHNFLRLAGRLTWCFKGLPCRAIFCCRAAAVTLLFVNLCLAI